MIVRNDIRRIWKLRSRLKNHCPGGCYLFREHPARDGDISFHVPVDIFWTRSVSEPE